MIYEQKVKVAKERVNAVRVVADAISVVDCANNLREGENYLVLDKQNKLMKVMDSKTFKEHFTKVAPKKTKKKAAVKAEVAM
jgi:hypothetical protein